MELVAAKCPSCGAEIDVDKDSDSTKCSYCNSKIIVKDAIKKMKVEISGNIEVNNSPTLKNLLKLGSRYYNDEEYSEAYKTYTKVCELDPDNYVAILRKSISKVMSEPLLNCNLKPIENAIKNCYKIIQKNKGTKNDLNLAISECNNQIIKIYEKLINDYNSRTTYANEINLFMNSLLSCLAILEYLNSIIIDDKQMEISIIQNILALINSILLPKTYLSSNVNNYNSSITLRYSLPAKDRKEMFAKREYYKNKLLDLDDNYKESEIVKQINKSAATEKEIAIVLAVTFGTIGFFVFLALISMIFSS